jgi:hypothetical protein
MQVGWIPAFAGMTKTDTVTSTLFCTLPTNLKMSTSGKGVLVSVAARLFLAAESVDDEIDETGKRYHPAGTFCYPSANLDLGVNGVVRFGHRIGCSS